jgi:hypothetical protein
MVIHHLHASVTIPTVLRPYGSLDQTCEAERLCKDITKLPFVELLSVYVEHGFSEVSLGNSQLSCLGTGSEE